MMRSLRLLSEADVERLIDPSAAIDAAGRAYRLQASGELAAPGRLDLRGEQPKIGMLVLGGFSGRRAIIKSNMHAYAGAPASRQTGSLLAVWDMAECRPIALISSVAFNGHRTAAGFAAAAQALAPVDSRVLAVFGTGHLALPTIRYLARVRSVARIIVVGRRPEQAHLLVEKVRRLPAFDGIELIAESEPARAAAGADIIAAVTSADKPLFPGGAVRRGTFVVLGGANRPTAREADDELIRRARIYLDHRCGCFEKAGDVIIPFAAGVLTETQIAGEVGSFLSPGTTPLGEDVTIFKSIGIAAQDITLADYVLDRAEAAGVGALYDPRDGAIRVAS